VYLLGIDVGTGGTRALVIDPEGRLLASATEDHRAFASPQIGWAEQDPCDWWRACGVAVPKALAAARLRGDQIACVGLSGQMHGAVLLDEQARVIRPAIIWCDVRSEKQSRDLTSLIGAERLIQLTCNPALTNFTLTKCLWVWENEPENWKKTRSLMLPKDYVRFQLTGERATDMAEASGTLLLDVAHRRWSKELLNLVQMDETLLPTLYESTEICGEISPSGAAATGLRAGTPVVAGAGDQAAGAIGMGVVSPGTVSATIGTSGVVFAATDAPALDPKGRLHTFCHAVPGRWMAMGVTQAAGLSLRWFRDQFGFGANGERSSRMRWPALGALPHGRTYSLPRFRGARDPGRLDRVSYARSCYPCNPGGSCFQFARHVHDISGDQSSGEDDSAGRGRGQVRALATNSSQRLWTTRGNCRGRRRRCLRCGDSGWCRRKSVAVG
jgi:xylulokinase